MFQILKDGEIIGEFLVDAFLVRFKMALHSEDVTATITAEKAKFTIMLLRAVVSVAIEEHKTEATAFPAINVVEKWCQRAQQRDLLQ